METTADLPFLLLHGAVIWKVVLATFVLVTCALVALARRLKAKRDNAITLRRFGHGEAGRVIRGKLGGSGGVLASTLKVTSPTAPDERIHSRAHELWIDTTEGRVKLEGNVTSVELGTGGSVRRRPARIAAYLTLSAGDDVLVRGRLEREPGGEDTGFRESSVAWKIVRDGDTPIRLAARKPRVVIARMATWAWLAIAGVTAFVGHTVMRSFGDRWNTACYETARVASEGVELDNADVCSLAAATPGKQNSALYGLSRALRESPYRDEQSFARLLVLVDRVDGCEGVLSLLDQYGRHELMIEQARRCGDRRHEHDALIALGRYDEAAALGVTGLATPATLIAARRWEEAAKLADEQAATLAAEPRITNAEDPNEAGVVRLACLADLLRHHGGDAGALGRIRARYETDKHGAQCFVALVEASPVTVRPALVANLPSRDTLYYDASLQALAMLEDAVPPGYSASGAEDALMNLGTDRNATAFAWIAKWSTNASSSQQRLELERWRAVAYVLDGDIPHAEIAAASAVAIYESVATDPSVRFPYRDTQLLPAIVGLFTPAVSTIDLAAVRPAGEAVLPDMLPDTQREYWQHRYARIDLRGGRPFDKMGIGWGGEDYVRAIEQAQRDHTASQLTALVKEGVAGMDPMDIISVLPRIEHGREPLLARLRMFSGRQGDAWTAPVSLAAQAAAQRELFRLGGDLERAAYWDRIYRRAATFIDRQRLIPQLLWGY